MSLISYNQAGFRKGHTTIDNIFVLHGLISLYQSFGKKLFCTFVDFRKAFDTVWRMGLWKKLLSSEIKGNFFNVIYNMYSDIKSCVQYNNNQSEFFPCLTGVRQVENLSPFLFSIYLNDLEKYFIELNGIPLELLSEQSVDELNMFIKLFVIIYADDTVILADTKEGMRKALNIFQSYCEIWNLEVNVNKNKSNDSPNLFPTMVHARSCFRYYNLTTSQLGFSPIPIERKNGDGRSSFSRIHRKV